MENSRQDSDLSGKGVGVASAETAQGGLWCWLPWWQCCPGPGPHSPRHWPGGNPLIKRQRGCGPYPWSHGAAGKGTGQDEGAGELGRADQLAPAAWAPFLFSDKSLIPEAGAGPVLAEVINSLEVAAIPLPQSVSRVLEFNLAHLLVMGLQRALPLDLRVCGFTQLPRCRHGRSEDNLQLLRKWAHWGVSPNSPAFQNGTGVRAGTLAEQCAGQGRRGSARDDTEP